MPATDPLPFSAAVRRFWATRNQQARQQRARGAVDQGARSAVTGGQQMSGFIETITDMLTDAGVRPAHIHVRRGEAYLPGFYRPTKEWDIVVASGQVLQAAVELKSHVGPSFGNNFNNRTEEAVGSAHDIWTAFREGAFGGSPAPWLGYLLLLEDCAASSVPVAVREPHFPVFDEFRDASYATRYELFCRKLVRERQYTSACLLLSARTQAMARDNYTEPAEDLSATAFLESLLRHVRRA